MDALIEVCTEYWGITNQGRRRQENQREFLNEITSEMVFKEKGAVCCKGKTTAETNTQRLGGKCLCGLESGLVGGRMQGVSSTPFAATN